MRRDAHVDDIGSDEANLGVLRGVARPENHQILTACRRVGDVRVHEHEIEEIGADVLANHTEVVGHSVAVGFAWLSGQVADVELQGR